MERLGLRQVPTHERPAHYRWAGRLRRSAGIRRNLSSVDQLGELDDVLSRRSLGALHDVELNPLAFGE